MRPVAATTGGDEIGWRVGDKAEHGKWGIGTVVSVKGQGEGTELDIAFPSPTGIKRLLAKFAPITKSINESTIMGLISRIDFMKGLDIWTFKLRNKKSMK